MTRSDKPKGIQSPHDALFKWAFEDPHQAAGQLRSMLPTAVAEQVDWSTLTVQAGSLVDSSLAWRHSDLLFSAKLAGHEAFLFFLFEHQRTEDPLMAVRVLVYVTRIWERWLKQHGGARRVPAIVPMVLYHGPGGWKASTELLDAIELDRSVREAVREYLPKQRFLLEDLSRYSDEELKEQAGLSAWVRLVRIAFKHAADSPDLVERLQGWVDLFAEILKAPKRPRGVPGTDEVY